MTLTPNDTLFLAYIAIGSVGHILSRHNTTPGQDVGAVLSIGVTATALAWFLPASFNPVVLIGLGIARAGDVCGKWFGFMVDDFRLARDDEECNVYSGSGWEKSKDTEWRH
jgi:hypothetical protein